MVFSFVIAPIKICNWHFQPQPVSRHSIPQYYTFAGYVGIEGGYAVVELSSKWRLLEQFYL
jgi:hypothetical protein